MIDESTVAVFEVQLEDVNNDGRLELLVTNNGNNGSVFVYEIPYDFRYMKRFCSDFFLIHRMTSK